MKHSMSPSMCQPPFQNPGQPNPKHIEYNTHTCTHQ